MRAKIGFLAMVLVVVICLVCQPVIPAEKTANDYFNEGMGLMDEGRFADAEKSFEQAAKLDPKHTYYHYTWAVAFGTVGEYEKAIRELKKIIKNSPKLPQAWYWLIIYSIKCKCYGLKDVEDYFVEWCRKYPKLPYVRLNYAYILLERKKYDDAEKELKEVIKLRRRCSEAYACLARIQYEHEHKKDIDKAIRYYNKAIEIDPDFAEAYFNLGTLLKGKGNREDAEKYIAKAIQLKPLLGPINEQLELVSLRTGETGTTMRGVPIDFTTILLNVVLDELGVKVIVGRLAENIFRQIMVLLTKNDVL